MDLSESLKSNKPSHSVEKHCDPDQMCSAAGRSFSGRLDQFAEPSANDRLLRSRRTGVRRKAPVADRGPEWLNWADSAPTGVASGRTEVRTIAGIRARNSLTDRSGLTPITIAAPALRRSPAFPASAQSLPARAQGQRGRRRGGRSIGRASPVRTRRAVQNCTCLAASRRR